ncbi:MAG TPA: ribonuclease HI family protein [Vicinamibacteria bacterium]|nr:ribonuclease HI family protein [Vicinamibacteria bacterium]
MTGEGTSLRLFIDGASRGNPGEAGFGVHVTDEAGAPVASLYGYLGRATNNVAEYEALLHALRWALEHGIRRVAVYSDSELVVKQMNGAYKVKHPDMQARCREAQGLLRRFEKAGIAHVPRERNREADRLANQALDEKASRLE